MLVIFFWGLNKSLHERIPLEWRPNKILLTMIPSLGLQISNFLHKINFFIIKSKIVGAHNASTVILLVVGDESNPNKIST